MAAASLPRVDARRALLFALTFVVAFCSIAYELVYSELLRVVFGGTVVRYSITIGLFLFSFGVGSFLFNRVDDAPAGFLRVEVALATAGPLGLVAIVLVNSAPGLQFPLKGPLVQAASHLPVVVVGVLSGLEVPYLTSLVERGGSGSGPESGGAVADGGSDGDSEFSRVLGMDYVGSLAGTVVYALALYPALGLVPAVFVLGLLNALAAVAFGLRFARGRRALLALAVVVAGVHGAALAGGERVEAGLVEPYVENRIEAEYPSGGMDVEVTERVRTRYQTVTVYERRWTGPPGRWGGATRDTCLRLDDHLQLCDSWARSYHAGLVDVPAALFGNLSDERVLLLGGGDHVAVDRLRAYGARVDRVDVDAAFMRWARDAPLLERFHDDAWRYDRLNTTVADAYDYLRETDRRYDLVLLDLPGARSDDLLHLYSREFYAAVREHLTDDGVAVTWSYSRYAFPAHFEAYTTTVRAAGFDAYMPYHAYEDLDGDGTAERAEGFYVLAPEPRNRSFAPRSPYVARHAERYRDLEWLATPRYDGVEVNSVFDPNYDVLVEFRR